MVPLVHDMGITAQLRRARWSSVRSTPSHRDTIKSQKPESGANTGARVPAARVFYTRGQPPLWRARWREAIIGRWREASIARWR